jgi:hypothetical protein
VSNYAGVVFGSAAIGTACFVWVRKQVFGYGGSALCLAGLVLLGLSIWHSVEFGVGSNGLSFKAAQDIFASARNAAGEAAKAAKVAEQAETAPTSPTDAKKRSELAKASEQARKVADAAQKHLQEVTRSLKGIFGTRVTE